MKITKVCCQGCGAALDVEASARFAVCGYCRTRMAITEPYSAGDTEKLTELSKGLVGNVRKLQLENHLLRLDKEWQTYREATLDRGENGDLIEPNEFTARLVSGVAGLVGVLMMGHGLFSREYLWAVIGIVVIVIARGGYISGRKRAEEYSSVRRSYLDRRGELLDKLVEAGA